MPNIPIKNKASVGRRRHSSPAGGAGAAAPLVARPGVFHLETEWLRIVQLTYAYPSHIAALNNQQHMRYSEQRHTIHDQASQEVYIRSVTPDKVLLDLCHREAGESIGSMSCYLDWLHRTCDMGIMVIPSWTNRGLGREAWGAVMDYWLGRGFKVEAGMMAGNHAMIALCETTGMKYEGERDNHFQVNGRPMGLVLYGRSP